ncbi:uncharacterized protein LOC105828719 isoform X3 [Monomorium pharaonis]|uniref:uncharacterized protein LOC105828719 isoform X3 n=1 Tax=Monomorium pharaonis TaxID=307658 RepID=UPI001746331D|nr:uncharacterized protein LOC105828719 isoform X3 [Monomorium pharaonis]
MGVCIRLRHGSAESRLSLSPSLPFSLSVCVFQPNFSLSLFLSRLHAHSVYVSRISLSLSLSLCLPRHTQSRVSPVYVLLSVRLARFRARIARTPAVLVAPAQETAAFLSSAPQTWLAPSRPSGPDRPRSCLVESPSTRSASPIRPAAQPRVTLSLSHVSSLLSRSFPPAFPLSPLRYPAITAGQVRLFSLWLDAAHESSAHSLSVLRRARIPREPLPRARVESVLVPVGEFRGVLLFLLLLLLRHRRRRRHRHLLFLIVVVLLLLLLLRFLLLAASSSSSPRSSECRASSARSAECHFTFVGLRRVGDRALPGIILSFRALVTSPCARIVSAGFLAAASSSTTTITATTTTTATATATTTTGTTITSVTTATITATRFLAVTSRRFLPPPPPRRPPSRPSSPPSLSLLLLLPPPPPFPLFLFLVLCLLPGRHFLHLHFHHLLLLLLQLPLLLLLLLFFLFFFFFRHLLRLLLLILLLLILLLLLFVCLDEGPFAHGAPQPVALEDGRPAEDQGSVRSAGKQGRSATREPKFAAEGVRHSEVELHETEEAPSAIQETQNRAAGVRVAFHRSETLRSLQRGRVTTQQRLQPR